MSSPQQVRQISVGELPPSPVILDVREDDEWAAGHIDGAVHIPLADLPARLADVPEADPLVVTCRSGGRSSQATAYLVGIGVEAVNLDGGMHAWHRAGRPMVSETGGTPEVI